MSHHLSSINPFTNQVIQEYPLHSDTQTADMIQASDSAQSDWKKRSFAERSQYFLRVADLLEQQADELGKLMAIEMGKPLVQGIGEAKKCALVCRYYAEKAEEFLQAYQLDSGEKNARVQYHPLGIVFAIMPWNFPFWQVFRCAVPSMMAGNTVVLKHAENVTGCAIAIEKLMQQAEFPENTFRTLMVNVEQAVKVIQHPLVRAVSLTGSTRAGRAVASLSGQEIKKCVLELGGSDAYCVLADADLDLAAEKCVFSRLLNSGQSCIAAKRWLVADEVYDNFIDKCVELSKKYILGNPLDPKTTIGPLARMDLRDALATQLDTAVKQGARVIYQSNAPAQGAFHPIVLINNIQKNNIAYHEELFGPIASIQRMQTEADMLKVANDTEYGLGGAIFTRDLDKANYFAEHIQAGCIAINDFVASDPRVPFGGIKTSGYGRELAKDGILEFVNVKSVVIAS